jgi:hypothetical protein
VRGRAAGEDLVQDMPQGLDEEARKHLFGSKPD